MINAIYTPQKNLERKGKKTATTAILSVLLYLVCCILRVC